MFATGIQSVYGYQYLLDDGVATNYPDGGLEGDIGWGTKSGVYITFKKAGTYMVLIWGQNQVARVTSTRYEINDVININPNISSNQQYAWLVARIG